MKRGVPIDRERFVLGLFHDLRNPLTAAKTNAQMILRLQREDETIQRFANGVVKGIDRANQMIQELLDSYHLNVSHGAALRMERCDLQATVLRAIEELSAVHGPRFILQVDQDIQGYWNSQDLLRALINLADNGIKYGFQDSVVTISLLQKNQRVQIRVHNHGEPLSADEQLRVFEPYYRTPAASFTKQKGWGLGLSLVHAIVLGHGGKVWIESATQSGTTFVVELPLDSRPPLEP